MAEKIAPGRYDAHLQEALRHFRRARHAGAITGAGISVESGIPDFRSPGGLWTIFDPHEYASLDTFLSHPEKSWVFFRALGKSLDGPKPNNAHKALAQLEEGGYLKYVITQNIDGLHEAAGSQEVIAVHGDSRHLHCLECGAIVGVREEHLLEGPVPRCAVCGFPLKPRVVLFGEGVFEMSRCLDQLAWCDALLVIGTSAQVYPVADFPKQVIARGGRIFEFNTEETPLTGRSDYFFKGPAGMTVKHFADYATVS